MVIVGSKNGFSNRPHRTSYWLSIETIVLICLVFENTVFAYVAYVFQATDGQTDGIIA